MNKLFTILLLVTLSSGVANAHWLQHVDYQSPNDSIEEAPSQVDNNAQQYAPSDQPTSDQNTRIEPSQNQNQNQNQNDEKYYDEPYAQ